MRTEDKKNIINSIASFLKEYDNFYLTNIETLDAQKTTVLRQECFKEDVKLMVVKNTLLKKALESLDKDFKEFFPLLKGNTAIMFSNVANSPAKIIEKYKKKEVPSLKGAYVQESIFIGKEHLMSLVNIKSKNEVISDIIALLQSPAKNVISALKSGGFTIQGILKTLSEKEN